ncbi:MAG: NAD(P)H-hydrate dehydratase [Bacteroidota bacterium]
MLLANSKEIREADRIQIEDHQYPGIILMEEAGRKSADFIINNYQNSQVTFLLLAGPGNNGGDALVIARHFFLRGIRFKLLLSHSPERYTGDAAINFRVLDEMSIPYELWSGREQLDRLIQEMENPILIDALLGTGINSQLRGSILEIISYFREKKLECIAIDLPSGLDASSGRVLNTPISSRYTLSFQLPKICHYVYPAASFCGEIQIFDIGLWPSVIGKLGIKRRILQESWLNGLYKKREKNSHKGTFGRVLLIGGSEAYAGAIALAGFAALKAGAGLVTVFAPEVCRSACSFLAPEIIFYASSDNQKLQAADTDVLKELVRGKDAMVVGPGMGQAEESSTFLKLLIPLITCPFVLDADGLNLLTQHPNLFKFFSSDTILTPHPGEMRRLLEMTGKAVTKNMLNERIELAEGYAKVMGISLVLKGAGSIIASPNGNTYVNTTGNSGMATAGSGDVLSGIIAGLLAQGYLAEQAACLGVFLHGKAGDKAAEKMGEEGLLATDIARNLSFNWT